MNERIDKSTGYAAMVKFKWRSDAVGYVPSSLSTTTNNFSNGKRHFLTFILQTHKNMG